ncbi:hypothetical protein FIBSPDRAFT_963755 [Athelia psychrophila]|uniref:Cytochrome P450 n=1 Tax=Athelia psychrophila TaxID=1759441 RepID=A0A165YME4_9AGAM|nr:hypothetical protein FIBSPDRAFT_963755 [Fibularhizoctonia sp. CBS 109695]
MPGAFLVDTVPILKHAPSRFPGVGFKRKAKEWKRHIDETLEAPFNAIKEEIASGVAKPSFAQRCLRDMDPNTDTDYQERIIKGTAGVMYGAGADTSVSFVANFVLAMIQYPAVQRRAQAELDSVLGPDRLPTFDDMPPYHTFLQSPKSATVGRSCCRLQSRTCSRRTIYSCLQSLHRGPNTQESRSNQSSKI